METTWPHPLLPSAPNLVAALIPNANALAMLKALRAEPSIMVDADVPAGTIKATLGGRVVFQALRTRARGGWIARCLPGLFSEVH